MKNKKLMGSIFVLISGVLWGHTCYFSNNLSDLGMSKSGIGMLRLCISFILMLVYMLVFHRSKMKMPPKALVFSILGGLIGMVTCSVVYFYAIEMTGASVAAVLMYTAPSFTIIISRFVFKEIITVKKLICLMLAFLGSVMVSGLFNGNQANVQIVGILIGVFVGLCYALYGIFSSLAMNNKAEPEGVTLYALTASSVAMLIFTACIGQLPLTVDIFLHSKKAFALASGQAIFNCVLPYILFTVGVKYTGPSNASIMSTTELVVAAMIGAVSFGERIGIIGYTGIAVVILSIVILNIEKPLKKK